MQVFTISLFAVAVLLLTAVPGYILMKKRMLSEDCIPGLSKILVTVAQPCLVVYTFQSTEFSVQTLADIGVFALLCTVINVVMLGGAYLVFRRRCDEPLYRIMTIATTFGNCAFFGIPIIEALFPAQASGLIIYTTVYALIMNILGWTVGSAIISRDVRYVSPRKIILNPATIAAAVAFVLFVFEIPLTFTLPVVGSKFTLLSDVVTITGKMCTPLSMIIMGMRLATMDIARMFTDPRVYLTLAVKQILMPLVALLIVLPLPLDPLMKRTFYVISATPVASVVLNFSELIGEGQREAANMVLLGTMLSVVTLPVMSLLLGVI